jgi:hypothetical protein
MRAHLEDVHHWQFCPLCHPDRPNPLDGARCCNACRTRLDDQLRDIVDIGDATAVTTPERRGGGGGSRSLESKPPIDLDRVAPYLATVKVGTQPAAIAYVLLDWERRVREDRHLAWVGIATAGHTGTSEAVLAAKSARASVALLRSHLEWITTSPDFELVDFDREIRACARRMHAFASDEQSADRIVECPTLTERRDPDGNVLPCGTRLSVRTWKPLAAREDNGRYDRTIGEDVTCPRCLVTRSPAQLISAAGKQGAWADPEAIAQWYGIGASTLYRWAAHGHVRRQRGMFSVGDVEAYRESKGAS